MLDHVSKLMTMNTTLLKGCSLEEVLQFHPLLDAQTFNYGKARKVKPIKVRPINTILDKSEQSQSVWDKILLSTLEGAQPVQRDAMVCWGVNNDVWQQSKKKLDAKYRPTEMDEDGWVTYVHRDTDNAVMNAFQVTEEMPLGDAGGFSVTNPWWGDERVIDGKKTYLHYGIAEDWVLQNQKDLQDVYRVGRPFFDATYEIE